MPTPKTIFAINLTEHGIQYSPQLDESLFYLLVLPDYGLNGIVEFINDVKCGSRAVQIKRHSDLRVAYERYNSLNLEEEDSDLAVLKPRQLFSKKLTLWIETFGMINYKELLRAQYLLIGKDELIGIAVEAFCKISKPDRTKTLGFMREMHSLLSESQINAVLDHYNAEKNRIRTMLTQSYC
jgi:hypothetical protein